MKNVRKEYQLIDLFESTAQDKAYVVMADDASNLTCRLVSDSARGNSSRIFVAL